MQVWRNWQTHQPQELAPQGMGVQVPSPAPFILKVKDLAIKVSYVKRGQAGVPTNLDWDGVVGTAIILMNK